MLKASDTTTPPGSAMIPAEVTESYHVLEGHASAGLIVLCDHANNAFPPGYGTLGLPPEQLVRHIAYDIGAAEVTRLLSEALDAPAVMTRYSRLLIDPNRGDDDPTLIMRISDGAVVPGNKVLSDAEWQKRKTKYYDPYHETIDRVIDTCSASGQAPMLFSIHSFTETWRGRQRPWHCGVLWDEDDRLPLPLLGALRAEGDILVGENEPYTGRMKGDCMWQHGTMRGLAHCIIELRQDLIATEEGQAAWASRLARILGGLLDDPAFKENVGRVDFRVSNADINRDAT
ncbi:MAG: N-formylglutamate amidohydrolase [Pseudomonadota bacterium]